jgi:hypothetical protein
VTPDVSDRSGRIDLEVNVEAAQPNLASVQGCVQAGSIDCLDAPCGSLTEPDSEPDRLDAAGALVRCDGSSA